MSAAILLAIAITASVFLTLYYLIELHKSKALISKMVKDALLADILQRLDLLKPDVLRFCEFNRDNLMDRGFVWQDSHKEEAIRIYSIFDHVAMLMISGAIDKEVILKKYGWFYFHSRYHLDQYLGQIYPDRPIKPCADEYSDIFTRVDKLSRDYKAYIRFITLIDAEFRHIEMVAGCIRGDYDTDAAQWRFLKQNLVNRYAVTLPDRALQQWALKKLNTLKPSIEMVLTQLDSLKSDEFRTEIYGDRPAYDVSQSYVLSHLDLIADMMIKGIVDKNVILADWSWAFSPCADLVDQHLKAMYGVTKDVPRLRDASDIATYVDDMMGSARLYKYSILISEYCMHKSPEFWASIKRESRTSGA